MTINETAVRSVLDALREGIADPATGERFAVRLAMAFVSVCALEGKDPQEAMREAVNGIRAMWPKEAP